MKTICIAIGVWAVSTFALGIALRVMWVIFMAGWGML